MQAHNAIAETASAMVRILENIIVNAAEQSLMADGLWLNSASHTPLKTAVGQRRRGSGMGACLSASPLCRCATLATCSDTAGRRLGRGDWEAFRLILLSHTVRREVVPNNKNLPVFPEYQYDRTLVFVQIVLPRIYALVSDDVTVDTRCAPNFKLARCLCEGARGTRPKLNALVA